jgi:hypothetical protein
MLLICGITAIARNIYFAKKDRRRIWGDRYRLEMLDPKLPNEPLFNFGLNPVGIQVRDELAAIAIFRHSTGRAHHILQGNIAGRNAKIFDYKFVTGSGKSSTTHEYSVVCFDLGKPLPKFELTPHTFWDKVTAIFGARDVQIGDPEFDKHFKVVTESPGWLQTVMVSGIDEITLHERQTSWHCMGDRLVVIYKGIASEQRLDELVHANLQFVQQAERY